MATNEAQTNRTWLFWIGLLLAGLVATMLLVSGFRASSAASPGYPAAAGVLAQEADLSVEEEAPPGRVLNNGTYTYFVPFTTRDWASAHFSVSKSALPTTVIANPGAIVTYTVTIRNEGDSNGMLQAVIDVLPPGFTYDDMAPGSDVQDDPDEAGRTLTWPGPWNMAPGGQKRLIYRVLINQTPGQYANSVTIAAAAGAVPEEPAVATVTVEPAIFLQDNFNSGIGTGWVPFLNHPGRLEPGQWYWGATDGTGGSGAMTHDCCISQNATAADALMMYLGPGAEQWTDYRVETKLLLRGGYDKDGNFVVNEGDPIGLWVRGQYEPGDIRWQWVTGYYVVVAGKMDAANHVVRLAQLQTLTDCWGDACNNPQNLYCYNNPHKLIEASVPGPFERFRWYTLVVEVRGARIQVWLDGQLVIDYTDEKEPFLTGTVGFKTHETKTASFDDLIVTHLP